MIAVLSLTACTTIETARKNGQDFANQLEAKQDVIETIAQYHKYKDRCNDYKKSGISGKEQCFGGDMLAENNIDFDCIDSWRSGKYYSDECIIARRNLPESKVDYFDYKRFLPKNKKITDEGFLTLVKYYDEHYRQCNGVFMDVELTNQEKENCRQRVVDTTIQMASTGLSCWDVFKYEDQRDNEYETFLRREYQWYHWAINHDPKEDRIRALYYTGDLDYANSQPLSPVYGKKQALEIIKKEVQDFGQEHLCDVDNWKQDMDKLLDYK